MQRLITLDGVIYVHQNPRRRRRRVAAQAESEPVGGVEPAAEWEYEAGDSSAVEAEVAAVAESGVEAGHEGVQVEWDGSGSSEEDLGEAETWGGESAQAQTYAPEAEADGPSGGNTRTIVRSAPLAPPPGYALEFGTGRLVKIHSYRGRMSYPSSDLDWS